MLRKMLIGLATITAIGIASVPMDASARGDGGGGGGHGGAGGFHGGVPYAYADYPYDDCYDLVRVRTYHGWRWRRVYVCG
jgi:hypothetical protein